MAKELFYPLFGESFVKVVALSVTSRKIDNGKENLRN